MVAIVLTVIVAAIVPGRGAEATTCDIPQPRHLYLELESVTVDGVPVEKVDESWAHLAPEYYWRLDTVDSLTIRVEEPWIDRWDVGGESYARIEK